MQHNYLMLCLLEFLTLNCCAIYVYGSIFNINIIIVVFGYQGST